MKPIAGRAARRCLLVALGLTLTTAAAAQKVPGGERQHARERTYDLLHLRADLGFDFEHGRVAGEATLELAPLARLDTLTLDAIALEVESVALEGAELAFTAAGGRLEIALPAPAAPGEPLAVRVRYAAAPQSGMFFQRHPRDPELFYVSTYGEGGLAANWLPVYTGVNDRFTTELLLTVPRPYAAIANGRLVETVERGGEVTYHWRQERPHPSYLIALYVGDYEHGELEPALGRIPVGYWVPRGRLAEGKWAFRNATRMVEYFSRRFDVPYPWEKLDQVAVPDYPVAAMEHTGVAGYFVSVLRRPGEAPLDLGGPNFGEVFTDWTAESTMAHELAHHWFGNNVTCRDLGSIWINEGFATYAMMLWTEESQGRDEMLYALDQARRHYLEFVAAAHVIHPLDYPYFSSPGEVYGTDHAYLKAALVLHMLRAAVGDDAFFRALAYFLREHDLASVESHDVEAAFEESTGKNLDAFFEQWVAGAGHPRFEVAYRYLPDRGLIALDVAQVQPLVPGQGTFRVPVELTVVTPATTWKETLHVAGESASVLLPSPEKPLMVSFDGEGTLIAEIDFAKGAAELAYQARHDALPGRLRALRWLAARFPAHPATLEALDETIRKEAFWGLRAEAAQLLGEVRTAGAAALADAALADADYRVRKAAVLGLARFPREVAAERLAAVARRDPHSDVVGTAIANLPDVDPEADAAFFVEQLGRDAWYDEIRVAALQALEKLARADLVDVIRPYARPPYHQHVRQAALGAWAAAAPTDPELHSVLQERAAQSSPYVLQQTAITMLGRLAVSGAKEELEKLIEHGADRDVMALARGALAEIRRVEHAAAAE